MTTTTTTQEVFAHCLAKPTDSGRWAVYADVVAESKPSEDTTAECDTIREIGKCLRVRKFTVRAAQYMLSQYQLRDIFVRRMVVGGKNWAGLVAQLDRANGKRRTRTISESALKSLIARVAVGDLAYSTESGGTVSNSYGYASVQTAMLAASRTDGMIRLVIGEIPGSGWSSVTNRLVGLTAKAKAEEFVAWADAVKPDGSDRNA